MDFRIMGREPSSTTSVTPMTSNPYCSNSDANFNATFSQSLVLSDEESLEDHSGLEDFQGVTLQMNETPTPGTPFPMEDGGGAGTEEAADRKYKEERAALLQLTSSDNQIINSNSNNRTPTPSGVPRISVTPMTPPSGSASPDGHSTVSLTSSTRGSPMYSGSHNESAGHGNQGNKHRGFGGSGSNSNFETNINHYWRPQSPIAPTTENGLSSSEWTNALKMNGNVLPVKAIPRPDLGYDLGCRYGCREKETLGHVLGKCHRGELLRNNRHHAVRRLIADAMTKVGWKVLQEVQCDSINTNTDEVTGEDQANNGFSHNVTSRRVDIIAYNPVSKKGLILDPTIRMEQDCNQAETVNLEKKNIYDPCIPYFKEKLGLTDIEVIGLYIGARGTISSFFFNFWKSQGLASFLIEDIVISVLKKSVQIAAKKIKIKKCLIFGILLALVLTAIVTGALIFWLMKRRRGNGYRRFDLDGNREGQSDRDLPCDEIEIAREQIRIDTRRVRDLEEQLENRERKLYRTLRSLSLEHQSSVTSLGHIQHTDDASAPAQSTSLARASNQISQEIDAVAAVGQGHGSMPQPCSTASTDYSANMCHPGPPTHVASTDLNLSLNIFGDLPMQLSTDEIQPPESDQNLMIGFSDEFQKSQSQIQGNPSSTPKELESPVHAHSSQVVKTEAEIKEETEKNYDEFG